MLTHKSHATSEGYPPDSNTEGRPNWEVAFGEQGYSNSTIRSPDLPDHTRFTRLIDPRLTTRLETSYSEATQAGFEDELNELVRSLGFEGMKILENPGGGFSLYITPSGGVPVPVALAGDGLQSLVQTTVNLCTVPGGLALLEEPEVFQHPSTFRTCARAVVAAV